MWIVAIAWIYVALMMALAEATDPQGSYLGAIVTFVFYGLAPTSLVMYLLGTPARRRARLKAEAQALAQSAQAMPAPATEVAATPASASVSAQADAGGLPAGAAIPPEGEEVRRV